MADIGLRVDTDTRLVDVVDAQMPFAVVIARVGITCECRDQRTEVKRTGGRRREPSAVRYRVGQSIGPCYGDAPVCSTVSGAGSSRYRSVAPMTAFGYSARPRLPL